MLNMMGKKMRFCSHCGIAKAQKSLLKFPGLPEHLLLVQHIMDNWT